MKDRKVWVVWSDIYFRTFISWKGQKVKVVLIKLTNLYHMFGAAIQNMYRRIPLVASSLQQSHI